jgi:signal transduction histidine kinase
LLGVALGLVLLAAQQSGWFRQADLSLLDRLNALVQRPGERAPVVVVAAPSQAVDARTHAAALANALEAGAAAVGFDETYLYLSGGASAAESKRFVALASEPRCVVAEAAPGGLQGIGPAKPRLASMEQLQYESGRARKVVPRRAYTDEGTPVGFVREVALKALVGPAHSPLDRRRVERSLELLDSPAGVLLDYSLRPAPVQMTTLESLAKAPTVALRERVLGRAVLLSSESWGTVAHQWQPGSSSTPRAVEPAVAWAIASALSGTGAAELCVELLASVLVLTSLLLMLTMGDRGLGGKFLAALVAFVGLAGLSVGSLACWRVFVPPCPLAAAITATFLVSTCLELAEAGKLIARESAADSDGGLWGDRRGLATPIVAVEETLRSVLGWHSLPGVALLLRDSARPTGMVVMFADGTADWSGRPGLQTLGEEALLAGIPSVGDWPDGDHKALAIPIVLEPGRGAALILATSHLPVHPDVAEFGSRVVRQLLAGRVPRSGISPMVLDAATRPWKLPLPARLARQRASRLARQQQAAVAAAWRAGPHEAVVVFDTSGRPVLWNRRAETLFDGEKDADLSQAHIVSLLAGMLETSETEVRDAAMGVLLHGTPYICDLEDRAGRYNYVASLTRVGPDGESPAGLALRCIDVTGVCRPARVEARLMSIAAHEMRTPLTSVMGYAELLQGQAEEGSAARRYAEAIRRQAHRMEAVVAELLAVTRLEAGREELLVEPVDMGAVARGVVAGLQPMADARHIALAVQALGDATIRGDVPKLERVVENLVTNGIKYSPEGASVSVSLRSEPDRVILEVADTGHGLSVEDAPYVFEKFYRAKNHHSEGVEGTGLGLAIVRLIVEAHGGSVSLRSVEGAGSTFAVALPVAGPAAKRVSDPAA